MTSKVKLLKDESGQSMVLFALLFVVICGMAAFAIDIGRVSMEKEKLQNAVDAAALAGAQDLPSVSTAEGTALSYAEQNGMLASETTATAHYNGNSNKIEVVCTRNVDYTFARVLGLSSVSISTRAVAEKTGINSGPFTYSAFSGSPSSTLLINGSGINIGGSVHSNYNLMVNGSSMVIGGSAEAVSSLNLNGSIINVGGTCQGSAIYIYGSSISIGNKNYTAAPSIEMPDFSAFIQTDAKDAGQFYSGNKFFNGSKINVTSPIYVNGDLTVNGSEFTGNGIIVASGNITFNGSNIKNSSSDAVCFYSTNGNIMINGSYIELDGIVYAPNGSIMMNGSYQTINGRVIGNTLNFNGSYITINSSKSDLNCLPKTTVALVE